MLDKLLQYHQEPESGDFTRKVMGEIRKTDRTRQLILWSSGALGCLFGISGVLIFQGSLAGFAENLVQQGPLGAPMIGMAAALLLLVWILNEAID